MSILVVDNNKQTREAINKCLHDAGYGDLHLCHSSNDALEQLGITEQRRSPVIVGLDLIILCNFRTTDDYDVINKIREQYQYHDIPLIVIAEEESVHPLQMAFAYGATDFIYAPYDDAELVARVRSSLRLKHEIDRRKAREKELTEVSKQLADLNRWLTRLSLIDSLTKVANRRAFDESIVQEWKRSQRNGEHVSLLMIDVDYFKNYNDSYGHREGDVCLTQIAHTIQNSLNRPGDLVCRYGGEEFAVLLPETDEDGAHFVATRILEHIEALNIVHETSKVADHVTVSIGACSAVAMPKLSCMEVVATADKALYEAKRAGRNQVASAKTGKEKTSAA